MAPRDAAAGIYPPGERITGARGPHPRRGARPARGTPAEPRGGLKCNFATPDGFRGPVAVRSRGMHEPSVECEVLARPRTYREGEDVLPATSSAARGSDVPPKRRRGIPERSERRRRAGILKRLSLTGHICPPHRVPTLPRKSAFFFR